MMHRGATNTIGFAEFGRRSATEGLEKNVRIAEGIAHETGHVFDLRVFGSFAEEKYFSLQDNGPFMAAWEKDMAYLKENPQLYKDLDQAFLRHMKPGGFGTKETFAELWANAHGYSALIHLGISDIRPLWPHAIKVVEECIHSLS